MNTPHAKALNELLALEDDTDTEMVHVKADAILTGFLQALGYERLVEAYDALPKWYS